MIIIQNPTKLVKEGKLSTNDELFYIRSDLKSDRKQYDVCPVTRMLGLLI